METCLLVLICLRFVMVILPQIGYIHPDEFFQSVEITAGDILKVDVYRPWEFESSSPLRSISFPYIISGLPITLLNWLQHSTSFLLTPYWLLVLPRLWMVLLSLVTDYSIHVMCQTLDVNSQLALKIYAISYVAMVYMTRTFSNSLEVILVAIFISLLLKSTTIWKRKTSHKSKKLFLEFVAMQPLVSFLVGVTITAGVFNRPTYLVFILAPVLLWIYLFAKKSLVPDVSWCFINMTVFATCGIFVSFILFVGIDTLYFNLNSDVAVTKFTSCVRFDVLESLHCFQQLIPTTAVLTPWNFISYNTQSDNLAQHGLHPRYLHIVVNLPLLLGPVVLMIFYSLFRMAIPGIKDPANFKLIYLSIVFLCPVLCLTIFPHQEPRFLLPVVPIACVLGAEILETKKWRKLFWTSWITFNVIFTLFFGFLHQGGVVPSLIEIQSNWKSSASKGDNSNIDKTIVFYKVYMPPRHLLISNQIHIIDLGGGNVEKISEVLTHLQNSGNQTSVKIVSPATVLNELKPHIPQKFEMELICPHLSTEDPPDIFYMLRNIVKFDEHLSEFCMNIISI